jgi:ATP-binding cassette, subfamily B, bacterial PglK
MMIIKKYNQFFKEIFFLLGSEIKRLPFIFLSFFILSTLELVGIGLLVPYVALIADPESITSLEMYPSEWENVTHYSLIVYLSVLLLLTFIVKSIIGILINKKVIEFSNYQEVRLKLKLMQAYQALPYLTFLNRNSAEYVHNVKTVTSQFSSVVLSLLRVLSDSLIVVFIMGMLIAVNSYLVVILATFLVSLLIIYSKIFRDKLKKYGKNSNVYANSLIKSINESINGIREIRTLGKEEFFLEKIKTSAHMTYISSTNSAVISTIPRYLFEAIIVTCMTTMVIVLMYTQVGLESVLPIVSLFGIASVKLIPSISQIMSNVSRMQFTRHSLSILYNDLCDDKKLTMSKSERNPGLVKEHVNYLLRLEKVSFSYHQAKQPTINNVTFDINVDDSIGIMGSSGSGKTTLINIILGLLEPDKGTVHYKGASLGYNSSDWHSKVAYLPQMVFLFDDSLKVNVALEFDAKIDEKRVLDALKKAQLINLVEKMPKGIDTLLGEQGVRLSGGQRQRVALARAFYHSKEVLILDESTSALDHKTEREIVSEIESLKGDITLIVVAHRLSTLRHCDQIIELKNGMVKIHKDHSVLKID